MLSSGEANVIGKRYLLQGLLGQGGMGSVYRATDRLTGRLVALKKVVTSSETLELSSSYNIIDFRMAMAQEFKLSASLRHPNIIEVLDYGFVEAHASLEEVRQPFFTMELLEDPKTILDAGRYQSLNTKISLLTQTLQALAYLHRRGILHRDLKPANVLVVNHNGTGGAVKVLDFGLSVMRERASHDEGEGAIAGTLAYMAPEVMMGMVAGESADLYAVGIIAYELFANRHPFNPDDVGSLVNQTLYAVPDIASLDISPALALVLERLLQKTPDARYLTAGEVIAALNDVSDRPIPVETAETRESFLQAARLVGRDSELQQLTQALTDAMNGRGSAWLIGGENGVGKSRLVDELRTLAMVQGALVMRGQSVSVGSSPYYMWRPILRWLCLLTELSDAEAGYLKPIITDIDTLLGHPIPDIDVSQTDPEARQIRILQVLETALRRQQQPTVIIFEDLHWAGSESLSALSQLAHLSRDLPVLVIASFRDDERPDIPSLVSGTTALKLSRLTDNQIADLSVAMLGDAGKQPQVLNLLQRETEGNVFFLIEVVRALAEEAGQLDQIGRSTLPQHVFAGGVRQIIQRRLGRVAPSYQPLLQVSAVIGRQLDLKLLKVIDPAADIDRWLTDCANAAVFDVQDEQWRFAHDRLRDGVLESLTGDQKHALHRQIAGAIETLGATSVERTVSLAYHWGGAGDLEKEEYYVTLAGRQVLRSGAYDEALKFFERALALVTESTKMQPGDKTLHQKRVALKMGMAEAHLGLGKYEDAESLYRESLMICEELNDIKGMAEVLGKLGDVDYALGRYQQAQQLYQESLATSQGINDQSGIARALNSLGNVAYEMGEIEEANRLYQQSLKLSREIGGQWGMAGSLVHSEGIAADQMDYEQATKMLLTNLAHYEQQGDKGGMADSLYHLGVVAYDSGELGEAEDFYRRSFQLRKEIGDTEGLAHAYERMGALVLSKGDYTQARRYLLDALRAAVKIHATPLALYVLLGVAKLLIHDGETGRALELLTFVLYHPESQERTQDEAERLVFTLEDELAGSVVEAAWEKGKAQKFDDVVAEILEKGKKK